MFFRDEALWEHPEYNDEYPFTVSRTLCDIVNCPGKTGWETMAVIDKQIASKGITRADLCAGVGDGGGENEGRTSGVHKVCEDTNSSYVKKRCMGHIPWRVVSAGLKEMGDLYVSLQALNTYLRDGQTWPRLRALACTPHASGGLGLMREGSAACIRLFGVAPPSLIDERPECVAIFLKWLLPKQESLTPLVELDLQLRRLELVQAPIALDTLKSEHDSILRHVAYVLIEKGLYLFYFIKTDKYIIQSTDLTELVAKASDMITSLRLTDKVLDIVGVSRQEAANNNVSDETTVSWIEFVVNLVPTITDAQADDFMPTALAFHEAVSLRMASHLKLTIHNFDTTTWMAAKLLSKDAAKAQVAAMQLHEHLIRRASPDQRTPFEASIITDPILMDEIAAFSIVPEPCLLWRMNGRFKNIFKFLAVRFLAAPDSVLECEGVHARWQWLCVVRRRIKFLFLNGLLKVQDYLHSFGSLPTFDQLEEFIALAFDTEKALYASVVSNPDVAGDYVHHMYSERFGLSALDITLIKHNLPAAPAAAERTPQVAWGNYVRWLFEPQHFYSFNQLSPKRWLFIAANKSLPNRDGKTEGEAVGRVLSIIWYEETAASEGLELHVAPVTGGDGRLELMESTIAEISLAAGYHPELSDNLTAREHELIHERDLLTHDVIVRRGHRLTYAEGADLGPDWSFALDCEAENVEDYCFARRPLQMLTKMDLARMLQRRDGLTVCQRDAVWLLSKTVLTNALATGVAAAAPAPAGRGRAAGARGAGRAAVVGAGRGRAGGRGRGAAAPALPEADVAGRGGGRGRGAGAGRGRAVAAAAAGGGGVAGRGRGRGGRGRAAAG